ncbi:MAG: peptidoglycan DD-metalloendopeptidase family protein [Bacteroidales bacterium]|nr:peptidoglycan DD-metalloendopeptidase family protein [Bacteroidales bacterium]
MNKIIFILIFILLRLSYLNAQSLNYYQKIKDKNKTSINYSKNILQDLKKDNKNKLDQLYLIQNELNKRKSTITVINQELSLISNDISRKREQLKELYYQLEIEKNEYSKLIYYAYLNLSVQDRLMYILSANSFNQAYKRVIYLKQLTDYRKSKYITISSSITKIDSSIISLNQLENEKKSLVNEKISERDSLYQIKRQLNLAINDLRKEISKIEQIEQKNRSAKQAISNSVGKEISKSISKTNSTSKSQGLKTGKITGADFAKYRRQHIWPLKNFVLLHKFGNYHHSVLTNIVVKNDGVELGAKPGSNVYAIYKGLVVNIIAIPGVGQSIIIRHGDYYSVYSKLGNVYVKKGQNVSRGQRIAQLRTNQKLEKMSFQIWKGKEKLNPQKWLKRF